VCLFGAPAARADDPVVAAAGDIACDRASGTTTCHQMQTSNLLVGGNLAAVLALGDNQYDCGGYDAFQQFYEPTWGRVKSIIHPALGNHEYETSGTGCDATGSATGYFDYFNGVGNLNGPAGERGKGYYSFDVGAWHLIAINSQCSKVSCSAGNPQETWLRADLAAHPDRCTLAYWHHSRFSSGATHGDHPGLTALWQALYDNGADIVVSAHDHIYERFAPQTPGGVADWARGIRQFVVGTGGKVLHNIGTAKPNSEVREAGTFGVLELTLRPDSYRWEFRPESGVTFSDTGSATCHSASGPPPDGYARPRGATPMQVRLVPAYDRCTGGDAIHGEPLTATSCMAPSPASDHLTVGSPDANGRIANSTGLVDLKVLGESPIDLTNGDQADVQATISLTDVLERSDLSDYIGELDAVVMVQITDRNNGPALDDPATVTEVPLRFTVPCAATAGPEGGSCQLTTTADGLTPGIVTESKRAIWQLEGVDVYDGGPDGVASTSDNTLFAVPGAFVP
jgi:calcineurin-like phosphoesterase family protein